MADNCAAGREAVSPLFLSVHSDDAVISVAMKTPGYRIYLGDVPDNALAEPAAACYDRVPDSAGVEGDPRSAAAFAGYWRTLSGKGFRETGGTRLYRLGELRTPTVAGGIQCASEADLELCVDWMRRMRRDSGIGMDPEAVSARVENAHLWLWEDAGRPVALAGHQIRSFGWTRTAPMYTPPQFRCRGYRRLSPRRFTAGAPAETAPAGTACSGRRPATSVRHVRPARTWRSRRSRRDRWPDGGSA